MKKKARFISFEGGEGAGKTTQIKRVARALRKQGQSVVITREPGGDKVANLIRDFILDRRIKGIVPLAELFLYEASRAQHVETVIRPALAAGKTVLCDRFADSSYVYQGSARGLKPALVAELNRIATGGIKPDLTFIFDLDVAVGLKRAGKRAKLDRLELEGRQFHERVRRGFKKLARSEPRRCKLIDAEADIEAVSEAIMVHLKRRKILA